MKWLGEEVSNRVSFFLLYQVETSSSDQPNENGDDFLNDKFSEKLIRKQKNLPVVSPPSKMSDKVHKLCFGI